MDRMTESANSARLTEQIERSVQEADAAQAAARRALGMALARRAAGETIKDAVIAKLRKAYEAAWHEHDDLLATREALPELFQAAAPTHDDQVQRALAERAEGEDRAQRRKAYDVGKKVWFAKFTRLAQPELIKETEELRKRATVCGRGQDFRDFIAENAHRVASGALDRFL